MEKENKDDGYRAPPMKRAPGTKIIAPGYCRGTCETEGKCSCMLAEEDPKKDEDIEVRIIESDEYRLKEFMQTKAWEDHQKQCDTAKLMIEGHENDLTRNIEQEETREEVKHEDLHNEPVSFKYKSGEMAEMQCMCGSKWVKDDRGNIVSSSQTADEAKPYSISDSSNSGIYKDDDNSKGVSYNKSENDSSVKYK